MSKNKKYQIAGIGELLWDIFFDDKKLGGAPANFVAHAQQLGAESYLLSALGKDELGQKAMEELQCLNIDTSGVQLNSVSRTGRVIVSLDSRGNPNYNIEDNSAWDQIEFDITQAKIASRLDAICFGTLAQRSPVSQNTIIKILNATSHTCLRVFDVNFRQNYYNSKIVVQS